MTRLVILSGKSAGRRTRAKNLGGPIYDKHPPRPFASLRVTGGATVWKYCDRTVAMSEAARRAVEKIDAE